MRIVSLGQRTPEWLSWRHGGIGSSDAPVLWLAEEGLLHFGRSVDALREEKRQAAPVQRASNWAMQKGQEVEPLCREWYEHLVGVPAPGVCAESEAYPYIRASLDGLVDMAEIILEIKYASKADHQEALEQRVPMKYKPQLLHQCLVTGSSLVHYVSHNPRFAEGERFALAEFRPCAADLEKMLALEVSFWASL